MSNIIYRNTNVFMHGLPPGKKAGLESTDTRDQARIQEAGGAMTLSPKCEFPKKKHIRGILTILGKF